MQGHPKTVWDSLFGSRILITTQIVLFHTLKSPGFENFLRIISQIDLVGKLMTMFLVNFIAVFVVFTSYKY